MPHTHIHSAPISFPHLTCSALAAAAGQTWIHLPAILRRGRHCLPGDTEGADLMMYACMEQRMMMHCRLAAE